MRTTHAPTLLERATSHWWLYLLLTLAYPTANTTVLRVAGWIGIVTGLLNVGEFFMNASYGWWMGVLHLPLLIISIYAFALGLRSHAHAQTFHGEVSAT